MSDYFSILPLSEPVDRDGVRRLARQACAELYRVEWLRSYLTMDGRRMLCWYQAPDAEAVRFVLRQQGSTEVAVWPAEVTGAAGVEPLEADREGIAVEFDFDIQLGTEAISAATRAVSAALEAHSLAVDRTFASRHRERFVCVVRTTDESLVNACLLEAALTPARIWRCSEIDPRPLRLFRANTGVHGARVQPTDFEATASTGASDAVDAVIIGAGLSGICMLERLVRIGMRALLYESGSDVGGVWYWNRYPGARVDSESYTYGFSFSKELVRDWAWSELFAAQPEIARYLRHVVEQFDLRRHMRFNTRVTAASYNRAARCWQVKTDTGEDLTSRYLIAATGTLSTPQMPDYPGIDTFAGESYHTARWPAGGVDLAGKRVGVVGTGATGVQCIQTIAGEVGYLTVFQRTPTYCVPQRNRLLTDDDRRVIRRDWAEILASCRESYGGFIHTFDPRPGLAVSAEVREAKFEELWQKPGFAFWFGNFADLMMNDEVNAHASEFVRRKICERLHDPEVARRLLPTHPFGTKRVPLENRYYEVYNRENVHLVDLRETPIYRITKAGIRTSREEHTLDVIVYATGFDAGTGALTRIAISGEAGSTIAEKWRQGPKTYLGLLVHGFPNFFIVNGPHNAAALCNAGRCIEQNVDWIARCIEYLRAQGFTRIVPTAEAEAEWTGHVYDVADATVLSRMTDSWFFGANTPGKPRRATIYAAGARKYRQHCEEAARGGYPGLEMS
jgi:cation diffusion facilitator CzcD-associated flavoprotein CzcO